ncbi:succinate dehydrogenase subunit C [Paraperlucidibaca baekdonensis]|uniref:Succinate dehydrogenase cytochrome b556 subunit n=1 Tax=Paraperlucidibaca baekdonensis TaxID=748120 RepID=A0A3E0H461_9GAMM|nr:succinate dehydrogenase, cytochrome b556 subunit [Paraperlucidibaca baekdonensis]REH37931.1 succinate dehydrogenase subunit C [Paraperlucidibaca baekdonensis]
MKNNRPVNLSLATVIEVNLKSPVAVASIFHRLSGILLFFVVPGLLALLSCSLASPESFAATKDLLNGLVAKIVLFIALAGLVYHLLAGIKHLIMDWGFAETLEGGRAFATATLVASAFAIAAVFVWVMF